MKIRIICLAMAALLFAPVLDCSALGISAHSAIVIDAITGDIVYEKNAHERRPMASTTKIMTAICALENGNPDDVVRVHPSAVGVEGSSMYLAHGEEITLRDLTYGLMLASGNDAAVAIAMHISGSIENFAKLMNATAARIGLKDTSFKNPNGLDEDGHYTTAADLAEITRYGMSIPEFAEMVSCESIKIPWHSRDYPRVLRNHNKLLNMYVGADGVKTGFTKKSGRCLVSSATREGYRMIAVTLNAPDDWHDHMMMLDYAFDNYDNYEVLKADDYLRTVSVRNGTLDRISARASCGFSMPVRSGTVPDIRIRYSIPTTLEAPVGFGEKIGNVELYYNDRCIGTVDAISDGSVAYKEPDTFITYFKKILNSWFGLYRIGC